MSAIAMTFTNTYFHNIYSYAVDNIEQVYSMFGVDDI